MYMYIKLQWHDLDILFVNNFICQLYVNDIGETLCIQCKK